MSVPLNFRKEQTFFKKSDPVLKTLEKSNGPPSPLIKRQASPTDVCVFRTCWLTFLLRRVRRYCHSSSCYRRQVQRVYLCCFWASCDGRRRAVFCGHATQRSNIGRKAAGDKQSGGNLRRSLLSIPLSGGQKKNHVYMM